MADAPREVWVVCAPAPVLTDYVCTYPEGAHEHADDATASCPELGPYSVIHYIRADLAPPSRDSAPGQVPKVDLHNPVLTCPKCGSMEVGLHIPHKVIDDLAQTSRDSAPDDGGRDAIIEECAKVCDDEARFWVGNPGDVLRNCAKLIRALKRSLGTASCEQQGDGDKGGPEPA